MINWMYYPKTKKADDLSINIIRQFEAVAEKVDSDNYDYNSNTVLEAVRVGLENIGFVVEKRQKG